MKTYRLAVRRAQQVGVRAQAERQVVQHAGAVGAVLREPI